MAPQLNFLLFEAASRTSQLAANIKSLTFRSALVVGSSKRRPTRFTSASWNTTSAARRRYSFASHVDFRVIEIGYGRSDHQHRCC